MVLILIFLTYTMIPNKNFPLKFEIEITLNSTETIIEYFAITSQFEIYQQITFHACLFKLVP